MTEDELYAAWHLIEPSGERLTGAGASMALLMHLRITRPLAKLLRRHSLEWVVDRLNRFAKEYRGRLSRIVPDVKSPRRPP